MDQNENNKNISKYFFTCIIIVTFIGLCISAFNTICSADNDSSLQSIYTAWTNSDGFCESCTRMAITIFFNKLVTILIVLINRIIMGLGLVLDLDIQVIDSVPILMVMEALLILIIKSMDFIKTWGLRGIGGIKEKKDNDMSEFQSSPGWCLRPSYYGMKHSFK